MTQQSTSSFRYLVTGGGTGGHVYPGLAVADFIRTAEPESEFLFVGARGGAEEKIVPSRGYRLRVLGVKGLPTRKSLLRLLGVAARLARAVCQSIGILLDYKPHALIGTGGYASAPVLIAALLLRPLRVWRGVICLHEQNIVPGRFNLVACRWVDFVGVSFPETCRFFTNHKARLTGYPLRAEVQPGPLRDTAAREKERREFGIPPEAKTLLVFGGSSGARTLNRALLETIPELLAHEDLHILHATGDKQGSYDPEEEKRLALSALPDSKRWGDRYLTQPYYHNIEACYRVSDVIVSRSGAGSVWEIASAGKPAILIPKGGLPGDHQVKNARFLERHGVARVLYEKRTVPTGQESADAEEFLQETLRSLYGPTGCQKTGGLSVPNGASAFFEVLCAFRDGTPGKTSAVTSFGTTLVDLQGRQGAHPGMEWIPDGQLISLLEGKWQRQEGIPDEDRRYVENRIASLRCSPRWQQRNAAVKLAGLIRFRQQLPFLLYCISDRTPAPLSHRLLGGDFRQVGFIRRNALQAVWRIHEYQPEVRSTLIRALNDPYFEVRSWAARAVSFFADAVGNDEELERQLRRNLKDPRFEVIVYSLEPLGRISRDPEILRDLLPLLEHRNWKIQEAAVRCLANLLERKAIELTEDVERELQRIPMKGLDFFPQFPLEKTWESFLSRRAKTAGELHEPMP